MVNVLTSFFIATLVTLFLQSILYGVYLITCGNCAAALTRVNGRWRNRGEMQWPFLIGGAFLLVNTTCNVCFQFYRCLELFVYRGPEGLGALSSATYWINLAKPAQLIGQSTVGDLMLIYRTFVVYRKDWRVIAPSILLWLADTACACRALQLQASGASPDQYNQWYTAFWALSVAHHIMTTLLLLYRLWCVDRSLGGIPPFKSAQETQLHRIMRSIAESGMLYTVAAFIVLICQATKSYVVLLVASAVEIVTVAIAFNLILIRAKPCGDTQHDQESSYPQFTSIGPTVSSSGFSLSMSRIESKPGP